MKKVFLVFLSLSLISGLLFSQQVETKKYAVVIKTANVRSMPSTQGKILFVAQVGEKLDILEDLGVWIKVRRSDGTVGFIWSKLVRIEVEKVSKPAPKPQPAQPSVPAPPQKPAPHPKTSGLSQRFEVNLNFAYSMINPKEFYAFSELSNEVLNLLSLMYEMGGSSTKIEGNLEGLKNMFSGGAEAKYLFTNNFGIGLGFTASFGNKGGSATFSWIHPTHGSGNLKIEQSLKANIYAPYLALHLIYPSSMVYVDAYGGGGLFIGKFSMNYDYSEGGYDHFQINKSTLGFLGGFRIGFNVSEGMGIFLDGRYTLAKFKNLEGDHTTSSGSTHGTVYYYEQQIINWIPALTISDTAPSSSADRRNIRPAEFNFSGFSLSIGLFYRF